MNIQDECIKIHSQFGMSEMANYKIQLLFDSEIEKVKKEYEEKLQKVLARLHEIQGQSIFNIDNNDIIMLIE